MKTAIDIVFIGAGNLATSLAVELKSYSFSIVQVYSRTIESAKLLADKLKCDATNDISRINSNATLYIFSLKDSALQSVLEQMKPNNGIWIHTAGSISMDIFKSYAGNYGVAYPFQTFSKNRKIDFTKVPFFLEASNMEALDLLKEIFGKLSNNITELSSEKRKYMHLTGVFACNFVNHLYAISNEILESEGIPFKMILPLIDETAAKVHEMSPKEAQTGPAVRFDQNIIKKHLSLLNDERFRNIYKLMSEDIYLTNKENEHD